MHDSTLSLRLCRRLPFTKHFYTWAIKRPNDHDVWKLCMSIQELSRSVFAHIQDLRSVEHGELC